jgi:hypothetical protein
MNIGRKLRSFIHTQISAANRQLTQIPAATPPCRLWIYFNFFLKKIQIIQN